MKFRKMSIILCMLLFFISGISVYAAGCDLSVSLGEKGSEIELSVYKVAEIEDDKYVWHQEYEGVDVDLAQINSAAETKAAAEKLFSWITEKNVQKQFCGITDESGTVTFTIDSGVYVIAKTSEKGSMAPVLFMLSEEQDEKYLILSPKFTADDIEDTPVGPGTPEGPDTPDEPDNPDTPDNSPNEPDNPDTPDDNPNGPNNPNGPDNPGTPDDNPNGPNNDNGTKKPNKVTTPHTGDAANVALWVGVLVVALGGIAVVIKKNHGKR